jgi:hypothetical protein
VKSYLDDRLYFPLMKDVNKVTNVFVSKQILHLNDGLFSYVPQTENNYFYQVVNTRELFQSPKHEVFQKSLLQLYIRMDNAYDVYTRDVYNLPSLLRDIGGYYTATFNMGKICVAIVVAHMYFISLMKKTY